MELELGGHWWAVPLGVEARGFGEVNGRMVRRAHDNWNNWVIVPPGVAFPPMGHEDIGDDRLLPLLPGLGDAPLGGVLDARLPPHVADEPADWVVEEAAAAAAAGAEAAAAEAAADAADAEHGHGADDGAPDDDDDESDVGSSSDEEAPEAVPDFGVPAAVDPPGEGPDDVAGSGGNKDDVLIATDPVVSAMVVLPYLYQHWSTRGVWKQPYLISEHVLGTEYEMMKQSARGLISNFITDAFGCVEIRPDGSASDLGPSIVDLLHRRGSALLVGMEYESYLRILSWIRIHINKRIPKTSTQDIHLAAGRLAKLVRGEKVSMRQLADHRTYCPIIPTPEELAAFEDRELVNLSLDGISLLLRGFLNLIGTDMGKYGPDVLDVGLCQFSEGKIQDVGAGQPFAMGAWHLVVNEVVDYEFGARSLKGMYVPDDLKQETFHAQRRASNVGAAIYLGCRFRKNALVRFRCWYMDKCADILKQRVAQLYEWQRGTPIPPFPAVPLPPPTYEECEPEGVSDQHYRHADKVRERIQRSFEEEEAKKERANWKKRSDAWAKRVVDGPERLRKELENLEVKEFMDTATDPAHVRMREFAEGLEMEAERKEIAAALQRETHVISQTDRMAELSDGERVSLWLPRTNPFAQAPTPMTTASTKRR